MPFRVRQQIEEVPPALDDSPPAQPDSLRRRFDEAVQLRARFGGHALVLWCPRPDSNRHGFLHTPLKRARLPIPPLGLEKNGCDYFLAGVAGAEGALPLMTEERGRA